MPAGPCLVYLKDQTTHGVTRCEYSLAIVSMPPARATAIKQFSLPKSIPITDIFAADELFPTQSLLHHSETGQFFLRGRTKQEGEEALANQMWILYDPTRKSERRLWLVDAVR